MITFDVCCQYSCLITIHDHHNLQLSNSSSFCSTSASLGATANTPISISSRIGLRGTVLASSAFSHTDHEVQMLQVAKLVYPLIEGDG